MINPPIFRGEDLNIAFRMVVGRPPRRRTLLPLNISCKKKNGLDLTVDHTDICSRGSLDLGSLDLDKLPHPWFVCLRSWHRDTDIYFLGSLDWGSLDLDTLQHSREVR